MHISILLKSFHTPALNAWFFLLEHQWVFESSVIVANESLSCAQWEKMDLKNIQSLLEKVQICRRCWKTKECAGAGGFFWRTADSWTAQDQRRTHEQLSQHRKTVMVSSRKRNTVLRLKGQLLNGVIFINSVIICSCEVYVNIYYVIDSGQYKITCNFLKLSYFC